MQRRRIPGHRLAVAEAALDHLAEARDQRAALAHRRVGGVRQVLRQSQRIAEKYLQPAMQCQPVSRINDIADEVPSKCLGASIELLEIHYKRWNFYHCRALKQRC